MHIYTIISPEYAMFGSLRTTADNFIFGERAPKNQSGEAALITCSFRPFFRSGEYFGPFSFTRQSRTWNHSGASLDTERLKFSSEGKVLFFLYDTYHPLFSSITVGPGGSDVREESETVLKWIRHTSSNCVP